MSSTWRRSISSNSSRSAIPFFFAARLASLSASTGPRSTSLRCASTIPSHSATSFFTAARMWSTFILPSSFRRRPCLRAAASAAASPAFCERFFPRTKSNVSTFRSAMRNIPTSTISRYSATCPLLMSQPLVVHVEREVGLYPRLPLDLDRVRILVPARVEARDVERHA